MMITEDFIRALLLALKNDLLTKAECSEFIKNILNKQNK